MLRGLVLGAATALALTGTALAQTMPWVSLAKGDLAPCTDTLKQFQTRWLSSVAFDRDKACAAKDAELCTLLKDWYNDWQAMSPADFMMDAPADCEDCVEDRMIDEFVDPAFRAAVPVIVVKAASAKPAAPVLKKDHMDGYAYMPVVYHCLSGLWVEKLFKSGQSLANVRITAQEGGYLKVTPQQFDGMVRSLTQKYGAGTAPATSGDTGGLDGAPPPKPAPPKPAPKPPGVDVRAAVRDCGNLELPARKRVDACTKAINAKVEGFEMVLALWARSISRLEDGDVDGAIEDADRAADLHGQDYSVQNARCWARAVGNLELDVARQACTLAIRLAPGEASVYDSRGLVGLRQESWNDAWKDYDAAVDLSPDFASALYGRGLAALGLGRIDDAEEDIAYALDLDPKIGAEYDKFGIYVEDLMASAPAQPRSTGGGYVGRAKRDRQQ